MIPAWRLLVSGWLTGDASRRDSAMAELQGVRLTSCPACRGTGSLCYCLGTGTPEGYLRGLEEVARRLERWASEAEIPATEQTFSRMAYSYREIAQQVRRMM